MLSVGSVWRGQSVCHERVGGRTIKSLIGD